MVWVQLDNVVLTGQHCIAPVAIFDNWKQANDAGVSPSLWDAQNAKEIIRRLVFERDNYACTHCGAPVTWEKEGKGDMHERLWRGRGGNISVANSTTLCNGCHDKDPVAGHGKRAVQWSR